MLGCTILPGGGRFSSLWLFYGAEKLRSATAAVSGVLTAALANVACALYYHAQTPLWVGFVQRRLESELWALL